MSEAANNGAPSPESIPETATSSASVGAQLAAARQSNGWTVEQVASQLNLAPRQIVALEADNYPALPGLASVRGFVRAYAKLLKIDATPLVALVAGEQIAPLPVLEPKRNVTAAPFADNRLLASGHRRTSLKTILVAILIVLLAVAAVVVERMGGWPALSQSLSTQYKQISETSTNAQSAAPTDSAASATSATSASADAAAPAAEAVAAPVSPVAPAVANDAPKTVSSAPSKLETTTEASAAKVAVAAAQPDAPAAGTKNLLVLKVRQDSWIDVKAGNTSLISRLVKAGSTEQLQIAEPTTLTLGNAAGVDVIFRGSPLEVKSDAKNNVARLSLK
ncbi:MAG: helix-turn-helix domain-containing protein [Burkholderiaceae bacterium]|nr:helix-turn-helix domain-containing protein [Burkholderiaceae bacterium]